MNDYLGNEIKVNDEVVFLVHMRTGSSTFRNMIAKGKVVGFYKSKVQILVEHYDISKWKPHEERIKKIDPLKTVVISN